MSKSHLAAAVIASALLLSACGSDSDPEPEAGEPSATETTSATPADPSDPSEPDEPSSPDGPVESPGAPGEPTSPADPDEPDTPEEPDDPATPVPADAVELCAVFETAYAAFFDVDEPSGPNDRVDPDLVEAFHQWGRDLEDVSTPDGFTDDQRAGVVVMARVLQSLPDDATSRDLEAIEDDLDEEEEAQTEAVSDYVEENCDLG